MKTSKQIPEQLIAKILTQNIDDTKNNAVIDFSNTKSNIAAKHKKTNIDNIDNANTPFSSLLKKVDQAGISKDEYIKILEKLVNTLTVICDSQNTMLKIFEDMIIATDIDIED